MRLRPAVRLGLATALALAAVPLWPASCRPDYALRASAISEGGGLGTTSTYSLIHAIGQTSPIGSAATGNKQLSSGLVSALLDLVPPAIVHVPPAAVLSTTQVGITADIFDSRSGIDTARLFFREGGFYSFREKPMQQTEDGFVATIPQSAVREAGLVYYIEAVDGVGNLARYPEGAPDSLAELTVYFTDLASPALAAGAYRMVSMPGRPSAGAPDSVLVDDLGGYNRTAWRLGRWNASGGDCGERCYDEYPATEDFAPGRGFWLISSRARTLDFSGYSTSLTLPTPVRLARGWNQIATPFSFTTDWLSARVSYAGGSYSVGDLHVVGPDTVYVEDNLISYDGAYHGVQKRLEPWEGYWIYNSGTGDVDLVFDPDVQANQAAAAAGGELVPAGAELTLRLDLEADGVLVQPAYAGLSPLASDAWDVFDLHQPPPIGDFLRVVFSQAAWGRNSGLYMSNVKRANPDGAAWDFRVDSAEDRSASLSVTPAGLLPSDWKIFLYDLAAGLRLDAASLPYALRVNGNREFMLVAGTDGFVRDQEASSKVSLRPSIVSVAPNPFTDNASVTLFVPSDQRVSLKVYSVEGRLVATGFEGLLTAGVHTFDWNGATPAGTAAPGIYFVRFETAERSLVRKIMRIR
ncbi:MAG: T9SS type A sorting domain-containing protein [bacterium]